MHKKTEIMHDTPTKLFEQLGNIYPSGTYQSYDGHTWFAVEINEMALKLVWFL